MYCFHVKHLRQLTTGSVSRCAEQQGVFTYIIVQAELYLSMLKRSIAFFFFFFFFFLEIRVMLRTTPLREIT